MTARVLGRVLVGGVLGIVLVASGAYVLVYLDRWEWNRALVSGVFFLAAEIAVVASLLLRRLQALEDRLDELHRRPLPAEPPAALDAIEASAPPPKDHFAWLSAPRTSVFVPILLGAGVVLSGVATVVERLAGATAKPVLEHRLALRLQPLALPAGGLLGAAGRGTVLPRPRRKALLGGALAGGVAALLLYGSIHEIGDATQTRSDPSTEGLTTTFVLAVRHLDAARDLESTVEDLWGGCQLTLKRQLAHQVEDLGGGRLSLALTPGLGEHALPPVRGCLADAHERLEVHVVSATLAPTRD